MQGFAQMKLRFEEPDGKDLFHERRIDRPSNPVAEKPLAWCIEELGLQTADWWADLETKFTIDKWIELSPYSQLRWVLIRLDETEASRNWKIGYYFSPLIKVEDVIKLL
jgi:hypothetical protein